MVLVDSTEVSAPAELRSETSDNDLAVQNLALYLMVEHQKRGQRLMIANRGGDDAAAGRELYLEWARYIIKSQLGATPYESFVESVYQYACLFSRTVYHVDWVTRIEPPDPEHPSIGLRAILNPIVVSLGLTRREYWNTFSNDRCRFLANSVIEKRMSLSDFCHLPEFVEIDPINKCLRSVDFTGFRNERVRVQLNLDGRTPTFVNPGDLDDSGNPYLPPGLHSLHRPADARLFMYVDEARCTRVLIPCSEILRAFYAWSPTFLQNILGGAFRRKSVFAAFPTVSFDGVSFCNPMKSSLKPLAAASVARRFVEREINAIPLRAIRTKQNDGYLALEVAPPALGMIEIPATGIVFRTGTFKTLFLSHLRGAWRPNLDDRGPFDSEHFFGRLWPSKCLPWQPSLPMKDLYRSLVL